MVKIFETEIWLNQKRHDVFKFFSDAKNLERITPPWLHFKILSQSTLNIEKGSLLKYALRIKGFPAFWTTLIEKWNPDDSFVDRQLRGPYRLWRHTHQFSDYNGGTLMKDFVEYEIPFGRFGEMVAGRMVERDVHEIFRYRAVVIQKMFKN
jgi:ligand-binding SRPBCC domain-containing protein